MKNRRIRNMVQIGMLAAVATVLMLFEFPLWFAPSFYQLDFSEVAVLIGAFSMGPAAGVVIETLKILLNFLINGTITAGVGELANFIIGCGLIVPAALIYKRHKTKKNAVLGMAVGTVAMTVVGSLINYFVLLPVYSAALPLPMDALIGMGTKINPAIDGLWTFVLFAVAPFNLLKGVLVSLLTLLLYKHISPLLKGRTNH